MDTEQRPTYEELLRRCEYLEQQNKRYTEKIIPSWKREEDEWKNENEKFFGILSTIRIWCENQTMDYKGIVGYIDNTFTDLGRE